MKLKSIFIAITVFFVVILFCTIINFSNYAAINYFKIVVEKFDNGKIQSRKKIPIDNVTMHDIINYDIEGHIDKITVYLDSMSLRANNHYFTLLFQNEKNNITCLEHFISEEPVGFWVFDTVFYKQKISRCIEDAEHNIKYTVDIIRLNKKLKNDTKELELELQCREEDKISLLHESRIIKVKEQWVKSSFENLFILEKKHDCSTVYLKRDRKVKVMNLTYGQDSEISEIKLYNYRNYQDGDYYKLDFEKKEVRQIQQFINYKVVDTALARAKAVVCTKRTKNNITR